MPRKCRAPYTCPCCHYETNNKTNIFHHFYNLKKPCPKTFAIIELTETVKEFVILNRIYRESSTKNSNIAVPKLVCRFPVKTLKLCSVTNHVDLRSSQFYFRQVRGNFWNLHPVGRPDDTLTDEQIKMVYAVVKTGSQGITCRQMTHMNTFRDSELLDSIPTLSYTHVEQRFKDVMKNTGRLYEGIYEHKTTRDTELIVVFSQEEYAEIVMLAKSMAVDCDMVVVNNNINQSQLEHERNIMCEKTKQLELQLQIMQMQLLAKENGVLGL